MNAYSPNPAVDQTIRVLLKLGLPPLPFAPQQDSRNPLCHHQTFIRKRFKGANPRNPEVQGDYCQFSHTKVGEERAPVKGDYCRLDENLQPFPRFTGKNPSYLDNQGIAWPIHHKIYQDRLPTEAELRKWFCHPATGIGTLGGYDNIVWLDFDAKNYASQEECDRDVEAILKRIGATWVERTGSGGWRIAIRLKQHPTFTNFSTDPSGDRHIGEALFKGRCTVLAPTIHPNGTPYRRIEWNNPADVESLESIGIYPTKDELSNQARATQRAKTSKGEYKTSNPIDFPWDMRNVSEHLEGYRIEKDYIKCKCPAHNGHSDNSLNVNLWTGAFWCWAGCDSSRILREAKKIAIASGYKPNLPKESSKDIYKLSFVPAVEVCERYFPKILIPDGVKLVGIKGAKGTGKTEVLGDVVGQAHAEGRRVLLITFREQLGIQSSERLRIPYLTEVRAESRQKGVALCWDSAHPGSAINFEGGEWKDADIIIDEAESVLWHGLNSSTCIKTRQPILKEIQTLMQGVLSPTSKGRVFCLDADLSDISLEMVRNLGEQPELEPHIILNTYQIPKGKLYHYGNNEELLTKCEKEVETGGKHIVLAGAQKPGSKYSSTNLEKRWTKLYPEKRILRIDSKTIADPNHPAYLCTKSINSILLDYDIVILTSVLECGVSIDIYNHFSGVWGFFGTGLLSENSVRQFLSRLRDFDVPRHCHFAEKGCNFAYVGNRSSNPRTLLEAELKLANENIKSLLMSGTNVDTDGSIRTNAAAIEAWGKFGARTNATLANYRAVILRGLEEEGYRVEHVAPSLSESEFAKVKDEIKELRAESRVEHAEAIATLGIELRSEQEYKSLKEKRAKTEEEYCAERRYELRQRYGLPVTPELVLRDDDGWYEHLRVHYLILNSDETLMRQESIRLESIVFEKKVFIPDVNRRSIYAKVDLLKKLGLRILLDPEREFTNKSPEIQAIGEIALANAADVKQILGISVTERSTAMMICQDLLSSSLGFRLAPQQRRVNGERQRFYSYTRCLEDEKLKVELAEREKVFEVWRLRDEQRAEVSHQKLIDLYICPNVLSHEQMAHSFQANQDSWVLPGALEDARTTLDAAPDPETHAVVLNLLPAHIRRVVTRPRPRFKIPGEQRRKNSLTQSRLNHLQVVLDIVSKVASG